MSHPQTSCLFPPTLPCARSFSTTALLRRILPIYVVCGFLTTEQADRIGIVSATRTIPVRMCVEKVGLVWYGRRLHISFTGRLLFPFFVVIVSIFRTWARGTSRHVTSILWIPLGNRMRLAKHSFDFRLFVRPRTTQRDRRQKHGSLLCGTEIASTAHPPSSPPTIPPKSYRRVLSQVRPSATQIRRNP